MKMFVYDTEVFKYNFIVIFKDMVNKDFTVFHNDNDGVRDFLANHQDEMFIGFNTKHYDKFILQAICNNHTPQEIKALNDYIIVQGGNGWDYLPFKGDDYLAFNNIDIMDDMQMGLSLKSIEGHLGMNIEETEVDFNLDRMLTEEELKSTIKYCKYDIDATCKLIEVRMDYLNNKIYLGSLIDKTAAESMALTNAKLTSAYLGASQMPHNDEREYQYPSNLKKEYIPGEVFEFFDRLKDKTIPDEEVFTGKLEIMLKNCPVVIGFGGIHGAIPFLHQTSTKNSHITNYDVASYYPHLMTIYGYTSRSIPNDGRYARMLEKRMQAKKSGDKPIANSLKLVANTTYGAMLNKYNDLYDPLMGRSVCITGQLFLLELANHLLTECESVEILQLNTDGIMIRHGNDLKIDQILNEWQQRTGFELEKDSISAIHQKDVNNYIEIKEDRSVKTKGGYLVRGISPVGAFNINNNANIIATAIKEYFVSGTSAEDTINNCDDPFQFMLIAKASSKYSRAFQLINGVQHPVQKCNRVYATKDESLGSIYKVKKGDDSVALIAGLPDHCLIHNESADINIKLIDKEWYIKLANQRIQDFFGERKVTKMAATSTAKKNANVYEKLLNARLMLAEKEMKKTGKNLSLTYKYFELTDIVPGINEVCKANRILPITSFGNEIATLTIVDVDDPEGRIVFETPMREPETNRGTNAIQALGSAHTYIRRYLYMTAFDICEHDLIDGGELPTEPTPKKEEKAAPKPKAKKQSALTDGNTQATDTQIRQLKDVIKKVRELYPAEEHPDVEEALTKFVIETKGFTELSKAVCEEKTKTLMNILEGDNK